jgi:hypothetical protein
VLATIGPVARPGQSLHDPPLCGPGHHNIRPEGADRYCADRMAAEPASVEHWHVELREARSKDLAQRHVSVDRNGGSSS